MLTAMLFCLMLCSVGFGQSIPRSHEEPRKSEQEIRMQRDMEKARNKERFQNVKRDTDRLLVLATELKQEVDRSNENLLSLDVVKKATEIEKREAV